jgi:sugar phosphate isomerase/epimerase
VSSDDIDALVAQLDDFDAAVRRRALEGLVRLVGPEAFAPRKPEVNLHCHTSFSYSARGYSPSRFAWEACRYGLEVAGIVDFDVLDGTEEFLEAGRLLGLKTVVGFETRVFVPEYGDKVTNSPNEPGVAYLISTGFVGPPEPGSQAARVLAEMSECARRRNLRMVERVNAHLAPVTVDYEADLTPLTPAGNVTERHMLVAYERRAREAFPDREELAAFWSGRLSEPLASIRALLDDLPVLKALMRRRLMKHGGVGYAAPEEGSFPGMDAVVRMTLECGALPVGGWLDGMNDGEEDPDELFEFWRSKGIPTVCLIPDRNWNVADPAERAVRVAHMNEAIRAAGRLEMPLVIGTEMNADGQKFVDTFDAPELAPHRQAFLDGAHFAWGHTLLRMRAGVGSTGAWADAHFGADVRGRNEFFRRVGAAAYPDERARDALAAMGADAEPGAVLALLDEGSL